MEDVERLIELLKREGLTEITVWEGDRRVTVKRESVPAISRNEPLPPEEDGGGARRYPVHHRSDESAERDQS